MTDVILSNLESSSSTNLPISASNSDVYFKDIPFNVRSGGMVLVIDLIIFIVSIICFVLSATTPFLGYVGGILIFISIITLFGLFTVQPNEAYLLLLFSAEYKGTVRSQGLKWIPPWYARKKVSTKIVSMEIEKCKMNDLLGSPIIASAIIVWRVTNCAAAKFSVDNHHRFIANQSEAALREIIARFSYDARPTMTDLALPSSSKIISPTTIEVPTLLGHISEVSEQIKIAVQARVNVSGILIESASLNHLAYAQEIASAMLQRQTAEAFIAARQLIVSASVGIARDVLQSLEGTVDFTPEKRQELVSNLLIILSGDRQAQPVITVN